MELTVYYDYGCPYVYRATEWLYALNENLDTNLDIAWRYFSLAQVNHRVRDGWQIWEEPGKDDSWQTEDFARGMRLFWAAEAARRQGEEAFLTMHQALLRMVHVDKTPVQDNDVLIQLATNSGLDSKQFAQDMADPTCMERLATDHTAGTALSVFGTPTFVFAGAKPAYLKLSQIPEADEAVAFWQRFHSIVAETPFLVEIKRPQ